MSSPGPSVSRPSGTPSSVSPSSVSPSSLSSSVSPSPGPRPSQSDAADPGVERPARVDGRTSPRAKDRRKAAPLAKIGMVLFAIGLVAIFADFILFAAGSHDLPLWLNLTAMLAPVGLGLGLIGVIKENRAASPALTARRAAAKAADRK